MQFQLTILGSNSAIPANDRFPSAQVLRVQKRKYLIDCGEGTQLRLSQNNIGKQKINQIFISHLHGDHVFGLIGLLTTMSLLKRTGPLQVFSPAGLQEMIEVQLNATQTILSYPLEFRVIDPTIFQPIFEDEVLTVFSIPLEHRVPCSGFLFREHPRLKKIRGAAIEKYNIPYPKIKSLKEGQDFTSEGGTLIPNDQLTLPPITPRSYAYCSDTIYLESIIPYIKGVDLLYHESTFLHERLEQAKYTKHSTCQEAATIAAKANVTKLLLGHYSSRYKDLSPLLEEARAVFPNTFLGLEGETHEVKGIRPSA